jgi:hypothetical protein
LNYWIPVLDGLQVRLKVLEEAVFLHMCNGDIYTLWLPFVSITYGLIRILLPFFPFN